MAEHLWWPEAPSGQHPYGTRTSFSPSRISPLCSAALTFSKMPWMRPSEPARDVAHGRAAGTPPRGPLGTDVP
jgi:hypothetical protein